MPHNGNARPAGNGTGGEQVGETTTSVIDPWAETYRDARRWVAWTARRRWPGFPCNDDLWAASAADWWHNGRTGRAA